MEPGPAEWLHQLEERNVDNVARTASYLELYQWTRAHPPELPWLLMAHVVSRNAGYLMTDLARTIERPGPFPADVLRELFLFLERANYLIFFDAWHHVGLYVTGRAGELRPGRTPEFVRDAYRRHDAHPDERQLVLDLVHNEQSYIERRVVHHPRFAAPLRMIGLIEASQKEKPIALPLTDVAITVGGFAQIERRIATGRRIFDEVLADRPRRDAITAWAAAHPHTGSRAVYGGRPGPNLRDVWPVAEVTRMWDGIHAVPEHDPLYP